MRDILNPNKLKSFFLTTTVVDFLLVISSYLIALPIEGQYALWAPLTVLIVIQPTRGQSYHVGIQRLLGTIFGSLLAIALIKFIPQDNLSLAIIITFIISLFSALSCMGNVLNGPLFQITGYTTAVVFLISHSHNQNINEISLLRIGGTFIGIFIALLGLTLFKKESDHNAFYRALEETKEIALKWVRTTIKEGVNPEKIKLRESLLLKINSLNNLSSYASSERFFLSSTRKRALHAMGTFFTILTENRAILRKLANYQGRENLSEKDFPNLVKLFDQLDHPRKTPLNFILNPNWKNMLIAAARTLLAGLISGSIWLLTGWPEAITFFLITLIHSCLMTTLSKPDERIKNIVIAVLLSFFSVAFFLHTFGIRPIISPTHFFILILPGLILSFIPKTAQYGTRTNLFTIVLYSSASAYGSHYNFWVLVKVYIAFIAALYLSLLLTKYFFPTLSKERLKYARKKLYAELREITHIDRPLSHDWMLNIYGHIESMLAYSSELNMDETEIINEGLSVVDLCVEILELRTRIAFIDSSLKDKINKAIINICNQYMTLEQKVSGLEDAINSVDPAEENILFTLNVIIKKIQNIKVI